MADLRRDAFSVSKTFTSVAVGLAQAEGLLDLDDPVLQHLQHLPQYAGTAAPDVEKITVRHLLRMSSGIVYRWDDPDTDHPDDPARDILGTPLGAAPGTEFQYRGGSTYLLSRVIHASSGVDLCDGGARSSPSWPRDRCAGQRPFCSESRQPGQLTGMIVRHDRPADRVRQRVGSTAPSRLIA